MKFLKKYWFKILSLILFVVLGLYVCLFGIKKARTHSIYSEDKQGQTVVTVWHIETFEGGGKSRLDYLKRIVNTMEKEDEHVLFMVRTISAEKLESELFAQKPDIVSFGFGVGRALLSSLVPFDTTFDARDKLVISGSFDKSLYAVPYMVGGYAMFSHTNEQSEFHCGQNGYINPQKIFSSLGLTPAKNETQYEAYKSFVNNKKVKLLGSSRDIFRVNNLNNIGRTNAMITPIDTYTDLIQYLGLTTKNAITQKFVEIAMSEIQQRTLVEYSLFSSLNHKLYYSGIYNDMENAIYSCSVPSVFDERN